MRAAKKENIEILLQNGALTDVKGQRGTPLEVVNPDDKELITLVSTFKKSGDNEVILVKNFEDLPEKMKSHILNLGQTPDFYEVNFECITLVLRFVSRKRIIKGDGSIFKTQDPKQFYRMETKNPRTLSNTESVPGVNISTNQKVIIKYRKNTSSKKKEKNMREALLLKSFDHPNLLRFLDCYTSDEECWIILEDVEGVNLQKLVKKAKLNEAMIANIAKQLVSGVQYLHKQKLIHRDLHQNSISISIEGHVKITDYREVSDVSSGPIQGMAGDCWNMAPEIISGANYSYPVDVWSIGVLVTQFANGTGPSREHAALLKTMFSVATEDDVIKLDNPDNWSADMKSFLSKCTQKDPNNRLDIEALSQLPFVSASSFDSKLLAQQVVAVMSPTQDDNEV